MSQTIEIQGLEALSGKFGVLGRKAGQEIVKTTNKAVLLVHNKLPDYPSPPPDSGYRRTGTLGRSITTEVKSIGSGAVGTIGTNLSYAPWVISNEAIGSRGPQAEIHEGRWWTLQEEFLKRKDEIQGLYDAMIKAWKRRLS